MKKKQRNRALKAARHGRNKSVIEDLHPDIQAGWTEGLSKEEALAAHPVRHTPDWNERAQILAQNQHTGRVPIPRFIAEEHEGSVMVEEATGRVMRDVRSSFSDETIAAIKSGYICLRCLEPQSHAFPEICESPPEMGCNYPMADRQILDIAMEFEGPVHLGPSKPIQEYLDDQQLRHEKALFDRKLEMGGSRMRGLRG